MPAVIIERIEFDGTQLYASLEGLYKTLPFIEKRGYLDFFIIEIRDESSKLVKRFKPMERSHIEIDDYYDGFKKEWLPCLKFSDEDVSKFNLGKGYGISILITKYNNQPLFPFEIKPSGYNSEKIIEALPKIEGRLLTLVVENNALNEAVGYLFDSYARLEENDIEGARTSLRKSLEIIKNNFINKIAKVEEEPSDYQENLKRLTKSLMKFVQYGGPHPGPAPRSTTEMIIEVVADIIEYLAKCSQNGMIEIA